MGEGTNHQDDPTIRDGDTGGGSPALLGPFRIKRTIGSGGMGTVYLCQQDTPRRDVAVKVMNPGVVSEKALRRFEFEAQVLARLQHPAIAQVYETGTFDDGDGPRPYFAMEYVSSARELVDYAAHHALDVRGRIELFRSICEGVESGHRRGVIHRDLKPGNILVDVDGRPKIIDFGVARSTDSDLVGATLATEAGQLVGTLQYMSPEQVELDPNDLDTRSDVYSLGVILYELLASRPPYDLSGATIAKATTMIREAVPPPITASDASLDTDLGVICAKAMEKDREHRYQSAGDLAEDLRRHLADEPILARPPTPTQQLRRFVRRNKATAVATVAIALSMVLATIISILFAVEARRQRDAADAARVDANEQRMQAEEKATKLQAVTDFQATQLSGIDLPAMGATLQAAMMRDLDLEPSQITEADFTGYAKQMLNRHLFQVAMDSIDAQLIDQPLVRAQLLQTLAVTIRKLGLLEEAEPPQLLALALRREHLGDEHADTLASLQETGWLMKTQGRFDDAMPYLTEALEGRRAVLGNDHVDTLWSVSAMGSLLTNMARYEEAMPYYREDLEASLRLLGPDDPDTMASTANMGLLLKLQGRYDDAEPYYADALDGFVRTLGDDDTTTHLMRNMLGELHIGQGRYDDAMAQFEPSLAGFRRSLGVDSPRTLYPMHNIGVVLTEQGRFDEALPYLEEALATRRHVLGRSHPETLRTTGRMGVLLTRQGRLLEARFHLEEALDGTRDTLGGEHPDTIETMRWMIEHLDARHVAEPDAGHDATAAEYQAQLDAINAGLKEPGTP